ncbi:hypothetical protein K501DRAFT_336517 [Backusella circina FSU 941]|nr:hypothetical protein K501DRAFT_336517 [Backusella circina FSU 941]
MLPQFGYIVAQAGADSHTLPPPPTNASLAPLLNKPFQYNRDFTTHPFYTRPPSPPSVVAPVLPPPPPFVYTTEEPKIALESVYSDEEPEQVKEYNDLMTWMDNEFWEQTDDIYKEKMDNLKQELESIIKGTHSVFQEILDDYECIRKKTEQDADYFMRYQLGLVGEFYENDVKLIEEEYQTEKKHLHDNLLISIQDQRKQIKEDESHGEEVRVKRNLRKRNADTAGIKPEPLTKRRAVRPSTLPSIHTISEKEEDELEDEFMKMKSLASKQ